jgi:hypothetical protein
MFIKSCVIAREFGTFKAKINSHFIGANSYVTNCTAFSTTGKINPASLKEAGFFISWGLIQP